MCLEVFSLCQYGMFLKPVFFIAKMLELFLQHESTPS